MRKIEYQTGNNKLGEFSKTIFHYRDRLRARDERHAAVPPSSVMMAREMTPAGEPRGANGVTGDLTCRSS
jgi:hypothetical protein